MIDPRLVSPLSHIFHANSSFLLQAKASSLQSLALILQRFIESSPPSNGRTLHAQIITSGLQLNTNVSIKLLILYLRCGLLTNARKVFDRLPNRTLSAYNYMIAGYFKEGFAEESLGLVRHLTFLNGKPDGFTLSMALKLSVDLASYNFPRQVHSQIVKLELDSDDVVIAALIDSYVKSQNLRYARSVYDAMLEKNLVCSTALIVGYMNQRAFGEAEEIFQDMTEKDTVVFNAMIEGYSKESERAVSSIEIYKMMQRLSYRPTISTFVSIIGACSLLSALEVGQQIHGQMVKTEIYSHVKCGSALVDMYAKCGSVDDAQKVFDYMPERNVFTWTSMIDGYGKNGIPNQSLNLFYEMKRNNNVVPNYATFLSVLSACGHAGLVSNGQKIFESMERDYKLKPRMEHYACIVDLLGRSGNIHEAHNFIHQIPEKPNSDVWTALLGASRLHGDLEMADIAAKEVFKLSKNGRPGAYIALSNTFAAAGKWKGVSEVRELMKARGVSKGIGQSWVERDKGCGLNSKDLMTAELYDQRTRCNSDHVMKR